MITFDEILKALSYKYMLIYSVCVLLKAYIEKVRPNQGYLTFFEFMRTTFSTYLKCTIV